MGILMNKGSTSKHKFVIFWELTQLTETKWIFNVTVVFGIKNSSKYIWVSLLGLLLKCSLVNFSKSV